MHFSTVIALALSCSTAILAHPNLGAEIKRKPDAVAEAIVAPDAELHAIDGLCKSHRNPQRPVINQLTYTKVIRSAKPVADKGGNPDGNGPDGDAARTDGNGPDGGYGSNTDNGNGPDGSYGTGTGTGTNTNSGGYISNNGDGRDDDGYRNDGNGPDDAYANAPRVGSIVRLSSDC
jgi:hypothetical protein